MVCGPAGMPRDRMKEGADRSFLEEGGVNRGPESHPGPVSTCHRTFGGTVSRIGLTRCPVSDSDGVVSVRHGDEMAASLAVRPLDKRSVRAGGKGRARAAGPVLP